MGASETDLRRLASVAAAMARKETLQQAADARLSMAERLRRGLELSNSVIRMRGAWSRTPERPPSLLALARSRRAE
jgi:hypothetical protein